MGLRSGTFRTNFRIQNLSETFRFAVRILSGRVHNLAEFTGQILNTAEQNPEDKNQTANRNVSDKFWILKFVRNVPVHSPIFVLRILSGRVQNLAEFTGQILDTIEQNLEHKNRTTNPNVSDKFRIPKFVRNIPGFIQIKQPT